MLEFIGAATLQSVGTNSTTSIIAHQSEILDTHGMKRTVQVNVKMTDENFKLLRKPAEKRWQVRYNAILRG